jgi:hypothetical protein
MSEGAFRVDILHLKRYRWGATFCTWKGTVAGILHMVEDTVIGETTSVVKTGGSPSHT